MLSGAAFQKRGGRWGCLVSPVIHAASRNKWARSFLSCAMAVPFLEKIFCPDSWLRMLSQEAFCNLTMERKPWLREPEVGQNLPVVSHCKPKPQLALFTFSCFEEKGGSLRYQKYFLQPPLPIFLQGANTFSCFTLSILTAVKGWPASGIAFP